MPNDTLPSLGVSHTRKISMRTRELFASMLPELYSARMSGASFAQLATRFQYKDGAMTPGEFEVLYIEALYASNEERAGRIIEKSSKILALMESQGTSASLALADHLIEVTRGCVSYYKTEMNPLTLVRKYRGTDRRRELVTISQMLGIQVVCELDSSGQPMQPNSRVEKQGDKVSP